ncbi:MAG: DUF6449 domain-containing protein [Lachnospiraceae bacterium]|nr:DUF6449 domain-containing protein [Lachnospiraceae bacterium]
MTSRHLYFKLFREDVKRKAWAAALLGLTLFFSLPVAMAMVISTIREEDWGAEMAAARRYQNVMETLSFGDSFPLVTLVLFCGAVVMGIATFSYLHHKKQVDFYHSLPVKRDLQFVVHITTGILLPALIYLIAVGMALVVAAVNGICSGEILITAVTGYLANLMYYLLVYAVVVLAVMMTGTVIASLLGTAVFFWYFLGLSAAITAFCSNWLDAYYYNSPSIWNRVLFKLSPVWAVLSAMSDGITPKMAAGSLAATVLLIAASFLLYQRRPSEAAGKTMAFRISMPIIKVLLVILFGMTGALFFSSVKDSLGWMVFGAVTGVVISHCVIEVIYHADFKKLFCHEKVMALCMTTTLLICLSFYFDLFRFDTYVPEADQVRAATIDFDQDWWVAYGFDEASGGVNRNSAEYLIEHGTVQNIPALLEIAREGVRQIKLDDESRAAYDDISSIPICYTLKNGRKVYRLYRMSLEPVMESAEILYGEPELKKAIYPGLAIKAEEAAEHLVYNENGELNHLSNISLEQRRQVVEAYQEEMMAMSFARRKSECPVGELLLISNEDYESIQSWQDDWTHQYRTYASGYFNGYYYPIYPSFTKTIAALKECGIEAGSSLTPDQISSIQVQIYHQELAEASGDYDEETTAEESQSSKVTTITCTDPEQIQEMLQAIYLYNYGNKNSLLQREPGYEIDVILKNETIDGDTDLRGSFFKGHVPAFILEEKK